MAGLRLGELLGLEWGDIDWRSKTIRIQRNIVRGVVTTPKSHQTRIVNMDDALALALRWHRRLISAWCLKHGMPRPPYVLPSESLDGTRLDESNARKVLSRICAKAELRHRSPHDLRHTFASLLLADGVPVTYVQHQLGHADASITLRVYAHWLPDSKTRYSVGLRAPASKPSQKPSQNAPAAARA
jgi:integrase